MVSSGGAGARQAPPRRRVEMSPATRRTSGLAPVNAPGSRPVHRSGSGLVAVDDRDPLPIVLLAGRLVWSDDVRFYRESLGWTRQDLEQASGVSVRTIGRLERGGGVREAAETALASALGVTWADLFDRSVLAPRARPVPARSTFFRTHPPAGATVLPPRAERRRAG